jgi:hypothetical protein
MPPCSVALCAAILSFCGVYEFVTLLRIEPRCCLFSRQWPIPEPPMYLGASDRGRILRGMTRVIPRERESSLYCEGSSGEFDTSNALWSWTPESESRAWCVWRLSFGVQYCRSTSLRTKGRAYVKRQSYRTVQQFICNMFFSIEQ